MALDAATMSAMFNVKRYGRPLPFGSLSRDWHDTVGLYGLVSYSAARRMGEVGLRTALGADRRDILVLLLREALVSLVVGVGCGVALGYVAVRLVSSKVVAMPALDTFTLVGVSALLSVVILAACLVPARRAARMNLVEVLRAQCSSFGTALDGSDRSGPGARNKTGTHVDGAWTGTLQRQRPRSAS